MSVKKKCPVVRLPTKDKKAPLILGLTSNRLYESRGREEFGNDTSSYQHLYLLSDEKIKEGDYMIAGINNHVVKATDCKLKETILSDNTQMAYYIGDCKKIIATTDSSLKIKVVDHNQRSQPKYNIITENFTGKTKYKHILLPQPSPQFITKYVEEYNKGNIITEVLVEYENYEMESKTNYRGNYDFKCNNCNHSEDDLTFSSKPTYCFNCNKLKINPKDNTITITKAKDKINHFEAGANYVVDKLSPEIAIAFNRWCWNKKTLEKFSNHWIYRNKQYTDNQLFDLFAEEYYSK